MRILTDIIAALLGLTIFIMGLRVMSDGLQGTLGHTLRFWLGKLTVNPVAGILTGTVATAFVQSSSAVAVMMVALVHANVLTLYQAFGIILGANIGTTVTAQIVSFNMSQFALPLMICGLFMLPLNKKTYAYSSLLVGLGALFYGLALLRLALSPLLHYPLVRTWMLALANSVYLAIFVGIVLTALVQSSSAVTGLVIALAHEGGISLLAAVSIALGSNIGTVATTLISSIGLEKQARATAYADLLFNVLGVLLILPFIHPFVILIETTSTDAARQIANAHTIFNGITALAAIPFIGFLGRLSSRWAGIHQDRPN